MNSTELADEYWEQGSVHYEEGRFHEAIQEWSEGLRADPKHADLHYNLGVALQEIGQKDQAIGHWREAVRLRPTFFEPHYQLVCSLVEQFDQSNPRASWRELRRACRVALDLDPQSLSQKNYLLGLMGDTEWEVGDRRAAISFLKAAIETEPGHQWDYERLGFMQGQLWQWRASWKTVQAMCQLPDFDPSTFELCERRLRLIGIGIVALVGSVGLALALKTRRG